jgi:hypothetical protein
MTTIVNMQNIETDEQLTAYFEKLPPRTELRFPSSTSFTETYSVTIIGYNKEDDSCILVPYFISKSHGECEDSEKRDTPDILARFCFFNETGLDVIGIPKQLGTPYMAKNFNPDLEQKFFPRYVMLIDSFKGELLTEDQIVSEKNGPPIKIDRGLLWRIFEQEVLVDGKLKKHRQYYAYEKFREYILSQGVTW